jgi:hypothetical protein
VSITLCDVQRREAARVDHQMLHLPGAPDGEQSRLTVDAVASSQAPQRIVEAVTVEDRRQRQRLVVGLGLA